MNGMNMGKMMQQVQQIRNKMRNDQDQINKKKFVGKSPEDLVTVTFTGNHKMQSMKINQKAMDSKDADMLSDLIISAVNDALKQIDVTTKNTLGKYTQNIPKM